jgi:hypothetical protein
MNARSVFLIKRIYSLVFCLSLLSACAPQSANTGRQATVDALAISVARTSTAAALAPSEGDTGKQTAVVKATSVAESHVATQTVVSQVDTAAQQATAEIERPVIAQIPFFDEDPDKGKVGWVHPTFTIEASGPNGFAARNDFAGVIAGDFVISADITWNTQYGDSGCGFAVRADGNQNAPSQYVFAMTRFANGHVGFLVISKGELVNGADLYPRSKDRKFSAENDQTNQFTVVGHGNKFRVYTNGILIGEVDPTQPPPIPNAPPPPDSPQNPNDPAQKKTFTAAQEFQGQVEGQIQARFRERQKLFNTSNKEFPKGFTSMIAITQAGKVTCTFTNAWLWLIEGS